MKLLPHRPGINITATESHARTSYSVQGQSYQQIAKHIIIVYNTGWYYTVKIRRDIISQRMLKHIPQKDPVPTIKEYVLSCFGVVARSTAQALRNKDALNQDSRFHRHNTSAKKWMCLQSPPPTTQFQKHTRTPYTIVDRKASFTPYSPIIQCNTISNFALK